MKKIYYIYSILACLFAGMLFGCTADELEKDQPRDFSKVKIEVNATLSGYEGEKPATKLTDGGSWEYGDIIYMCVGSEDNSFTLTYKGAGEWHFDSWLGGDLKNSFSASSGTLTAIYCTEGKNWTRKGGKIKGETHGDVVYTKKGKYEWAGDKLVFTINLNERNVSKLVVEDVEPGWTLVQKTDYGAEVQPWIALTQFLDPGWDPWLGGFDDPSYKYDSSTKKLTAWGIFGTTYNTFCIANKSKTTIYARDYFSKGLNPGQKVTIKGPFGDEASMWRKYVDGVQIKRAVVKYKTNDDNSYKVLPPKFKLERADGISVKIFGEDGEEIKFSGSDKAKFTVDDSSILFPFSFEKNGIIMGGNSKGSTFLNIKLPSYYELEKSRYEFEVTDANFENRLQLYIAKDINGEYKPIGYHYDDVKKGDVLYLKIKYGGEWKAIGSKTTGGRIKYFIQVEKDGDTFDAIEIKSMKSSESQLFLDVYQITVKNKHSSAVTAEISFKLVSDPTKIGDFLILAFK